MFKRIVLFSLLTLALPTSWAHAQVIQFPVPPRWSATITVRFTPDPNPSWPKLVQVSPRAMGAWSPFFQADNCGFSADPNPFKIASTQAGFTLFIAAGSHPTVVPDDCDPNTVYNIGNPIPDPANGTTNTFNWRVPDGDGGACLITIGLEHTLDSLRNVTSNPDYSSMVAQIKGNPGWKWVVNNYKLDANPSWEPFRNAIAGNPDWKHVKAMVTKAEKDAQHPLTIQNSVKTKIIRIGKKIKLRYHVSRQKRPHFTGSEEQN